MDKSVMIPTRYYQQFDADQSLKTPAEGYGGWRKENLPLNFSRTAVVVMHAWDCGNWDEYPGWHRAVEYISRSHKISRNVFPSFLTAVRNSKVRVFHVVKPGADYFKHYPGCQGGSNVSNSKINGKNLNRVISESVYEQLHQFKRENSFPGKHNAEDIIRGNQKLDFPNEARPIGDEGIAESAEQLHALAKEAGINHLIYTGFAINGCLWTSPGGMLDMSKKGYLCSTIPETVTAIENKETAAREQAKEYALWYVALVFGFVYDLEDFLAAIERSIVWEGH